MATLAPPPDTSTATFLEGGGELGALMRAFDWTKTPLGLPTQWPRSLKTAVRIMLTSQQPFWLGWGPELTYLYNDPYKSIIGGKHPHALGKPFSEVWSEIWDVVGPMAENVITKDEGIYVEEQLLIMERHGYAEETYYTFSYSPVPDDEGGIGGLICANSEDTGRVIGERQLALLRELAEKSAPARTRRDACTLTVEALQANTRDLPFALLYLDGDGRPLDLAAATPATEALAGEPRWKLADVVGDSPLRQVSLEGLEGLPKGGWIVPPREAAVLPIVAAGGQGRAGVLVLGLNPFRRMDAGYRGFLELVSGQVSASIANAEAYEQERHRAEALAELDRAKTAFFSNVSHEFRTPLTLMLGPIEDLLAKSEQDAGGEQRQLLSVVQRNGHRLLKLVNTLLDFARIEAGRAQTTFEPTDLGAFTTDLAANFRAACDRAGIGLAVQCPPASEPAWIDREMWEKVVLNLLSNAFKFTLAGHIDVRLREAPEGFVLTVADTGAGIPAESLPNMFQRFHRVEGTRGRSHEGSGIGLALVHELVKAHGGQIEVASEFGKGTEFTITIPRGHQHLPPDRVMQQSEAAPAPVRAGAYVEEALSWLPGTQAAEITAPAEAPLVLVADDNADLRDYLRRLLAPHYRVEMAVDGEEALASIRTHKPDLVVSDVMMPRLDGIGLVRAIRAEAAVSSTPIVLLSARAGEEARITGMASGADDYLVKPFSARELLVRVGGLLQAAAIRRTANEQFARTAAQFEALLEAAPMGVYLVDDQFRIASVNPVALPVFGAIPDLIGRDFDEVIHMLWPKEIADGISRNFRHTLETGEPFEQAEYAEKRLDIGITEYYEWHLHRIPLPGGRFGVVCYFRDISAVVYAREALRDSDKRKDEFIATLSHELRNPLAPIRNALYILGMSREADKSIARVHEMMERQVNHLVRLVDDLLEISRISRGKLELRREAVELAPIVRHAVETAEPLMQSSRHRLSVSLPEEPLWLNGDSVRLGQILGNVLTNAAKYTENGGEIRLDARRDGDRVAIRVADSGIGIPAGELDTIFEMFTRGGNHGAQGGLGIGLALARQLVHLHGGSIEARSEGPGRGSEFTIHLPLQEMAPAGDSLTGNLGDALLGKRVLVVDDNRDAGDSIAMILRLLGAEVRVARSGVEAIDTLADFTAEVVLLDIGMPEMDGYEVARRIQERFRERRPVIVALTGWGQEQDRARAREAGFDHHLVKPAEITALKSLLASI